MIRKFLKIMCVFLIAVFTSLLVVYGSMHIAEGTIADKMVWKYIRTIILLVSLNVSAAIIFCYRQRITTLISSVLMMASGMVCLKQEFDTLLLFAIAFTILSLLIGICGVLTETMPNKNKETKLPKEIASA